MRNVKLTLEYDGTEFSGWQSQTQGERTVQTVVLRSILELTGEGTKLIAAGRTDAGVHALGQVAAFRTSSKLPADIIRRALNARLPRDVRVLGAHDVDDSFHPRYGALGKRYTYLIANSETASPFVRRYAWHIPQGLGIEAMAAGAGCFLGKHDFRAFMGAGSGVKDTVREIGLFTVERLERAGLPGLALRGTFVKITVEGSGFLRHMVRNMAGTLVEIAKGKMPRESIAGIMEGRDRRKAGPTAPAHGLFLEGVSYPR
jgi:tRNA pseudouridine38-40 synthase